MYLLSKYLHCESAQAMHAVRISVAHCTQTIFLGAPLKDIHAVSTTTTGSVHGMAILLWELTVYVHTVHMCVMSSGNSTIYVHHITWQSH